MSDYGSKRSKLKKIKITQFDKTQKIHLRKSISRSQIDLTFQGQIYTVFQLVRKRNITKLSSILWPPPPPLKKLVGFACFSGSLYYIAEDPSKPVPIVNNRATKIRFSGARNSVLLKASPGERRTPHDFVLLLTLRGTCVHLIVYLIVNQMK